MDLLDNSIFDIPLYTMNKIKCKGRIVDIYDGDTVTAVFNFNNIIQKYKIRLFGIDAPEIKGSTCIDGLASRNFLISNIINKNINLDKNYKKSEIINMLKECKKIFIFDLLGEDKYGRILANIYDDNECINDILLLHGYAKEYIL
jgi:micrococcal nuclease